MKRRLALTCEVADRETPTSLVSRLAIRNMVRDASEFCLDMGLRWKRITMGDAKEVARLAEIAGLPAAPLQRYTIRSIGPACHKVGRELASNRSIKRMGGEHCPLCLKESVGELGFAGAFRRADWQFLSIRCCEVHLTPLVPLPEEKFATHAYDFARVVEKQWSLVSAAAEKATDLRREPTPLEQYIRRRLSGWRGKDWIDGLALPVVSKSSEMLGMRMLFGPQAGSTQLTDPDWHRCGEAGFDVLRLGPPALIRALKEFKAEFRSPFASHNRDFGGFFLWLSRDLSMSGTEPVRKVVRQFILENYPVVAGSCILGRQIDRPLCLTLGSVEKSLGIRQERLVNMLIEVDPACDATDPPTFVKVGQLELLKQRIKDIVSFQEARQLLGCSTHYVAGFARAGMLRRRRDAADKTYLSREDLVAFIRPVTDLPTAAPSSGLVTIYEASTRLRRSVVKIYSHFLKGDFRRARRDPSRHGVDALLLDPGEILEATTQPLETTEPSLDDVRRLLQINHATLFLLTKAGHLPTFTARPPISSYPRKHIRMADVEIFSRHYISLGKLCGEIGARSHGGIVARLAAAGIRPAFLGERITRIYRRSELIDQQWPGLSSGARAAVRRDDS